MKAAVRTIRRRRKFWCKGHEVPNATTNSLIKAVRPTGGIGVVGVFVAEDPKAEDALARKGQLALDFGQL